MNLTIRQLEILVAAADAGTFSAAAARLGISQPALSETIRRLEGETGLRLFDRTTRSLALTADGRHAVAVAREVVRDFQASLGSIVDRSKGRRGRVTLAALPSIACAVLPEAVRGFRKEFPGVVVGVHDVLHERAVAFVADGQADIALTTGPGRLDGLLFEELGSDELLLVCGKSHPLARAKDIGWRDLAAYPFVAMARTSSVRRLTDAAFINSGITLDPAYEVEQIPSAAALVQAGLGITALPSLTLAMFKGQGLVTRALRRPTMRRPMGFIRLARRTPAEPVLALVRHLRRSFERQRG
jgi:LysR family transcriptional regulator, carnitine catabolism transcriptional activator